MEYTNLHLCVLLTSNQGIPTNLIKTIDAYTRETANKHEYMGNLQRKFLKVLEFVNGTLIVRSRLILQWMKL